MHCRQREPAVHKQAGGGPLFREVSVYSQGGGGGRPQADAEGKGSGVHPEGNENPSRASSMAQQVKNLPAKAGDPGDRVPGSGGSTGGGQSLDNPHGRRSLVGYTQSMRSQKSQTTERLGSKQAKGFKEGCDVIPPAGRQVALTSPWGINEG